jgi:hypothetical protein
LVARTPNAALVTESIFLNGNWKDAVDMVRDSAPSVPVIVVMREFDVALWGHALNSGVMPGPYDARCLARLLAGAFRNRAGQGRDESAAGRPTSGIADWGAASRCGSGCRFPIDPVLRLQIGGSEIRADRKCRGCLVLRTVSRWRGCQHILDERLTVEEVLASIKRRRRG